MSQEHLFLVCELLRANLYEFQKYNRDSGNPPYFVLQRVQSIARQACPVTPHMPHLKALNSWCQVLEIGFMQWMPSPDHWCCYFIELALQYSRLPALQVLTSLAFLHSLGLIHSDLKPENILIKSYSRFSFPLLCCWNLLVQQSRVPAHGIDACGECT